MNSQIEDMRYTIEKLRDIISDLREENRKLESKLDSAEYKIKNELEPRIKREERSYDNWVTDPER